MRIHLYEDFMRWTMSDEMIDYVCTVIGEAVKKSEY